MHRMAKTSKKFSEINTTQLKTTTMEGKVRKLRVNIKDFQKAKTSLNQSEGNTKSRSCFIKLPRMPFNTLCIINNNDNILPGDSKLTNKSVKFNQCTEYKTQPADTLQASGNLRKSVRITSRKYRAVKDTISGYEDLPRILKPGVLKPTTKKIVGKTIRTAFKNDENKPDSSIIAATCNVKSKSTDTTKDRQNKHDQLPSCSAKRFEIKLQRSPFKKIRIKANKNMSNTNPTGKTRSRNINNSKLKLTATTRSKENQTADVENILISPPYRTRKCVVKLPKTPISNRISMKQYTKNLPHSKHQNGNEKEKIDQLSNKNNNFNTETMKVISANKEINQLDCQKTLRKTTDINSIKHMAKLSLRRQNAAKKKNAAITEVAQHEPTQNSTICFEPVRNSTLLDLDITKSNRQETPGKLTSSKDKSSSQNLANKSEEIENLLNSLDDEIDPNSKENISGSNFITIDHSQNKNLVSKNISNSNCKNIKFFHNKGRVPGNILKEPSVQNIKFPNSQITKKRSIRARRSSIAKSENIYEFLSQSQTSDSESAKHADPTADIIKKLIDQGKVRVATACKGKGRLILKRQKRLPSHKKKVKQAADKRLKQLKTQNTKKVTFTEETKDNPYEEDDNFLDHFDDVDDREDIFSNASNKSKPKNISIDQEGTFSRLARTVLMNQAERSDTQVKNASKMLNAIKEFFSTPKTKTIPRQTTLATDLSPITLSPPKTATKASPWRINEDAYLPKMFNFSRSSGNLPSFSSDIIPVTPRMGKSLRKSIMNEKSPTISKHSSLSSITSIQSPSICDNMQPHASPNLNEPSQMSSFSSNDSNAENVPPSTCAPELYNENNNIFDLKQFPNPRKALGKRSPLKNINILEVVHLPPYKSANKTVNPKEVSRETTGMFGFEENLSDVSLRRNQSVADVNTVRQNDTLEETEHHHKQDLYGFEDYLSRTEFHSQDNDDTCNYHTLRNSQNLTIHEKLEDLKKFKPQENVLEKFQQKESPTKPTKTMPLFGYDPSKEDGMRQKNIKEMLCSTMIHAQPSTSKEALRNFNNPKLPKFTKDADLSELFKDCDPETTFKEYENHRTYVRPYKRKRRFKENKCVLVLESDESDDDSNDHNNSMQESPKKKRHRKDPKENKLLADLIEEFEEIVREVNEYEMVVEKSI